MSQEDTYRPAVLPSEAVMMPAVEESPETPLPTAQEEPETDTVGMAPARARGTGQTLERIRNRMRSVDTRFAKWRNAAEIPLDGVTASQTTAMPQPQQPERPPSRMMAQGTALSTLMRSATRQHSPAPALTTSSVKTQPPSPEHPKMRGALRQVIRNTQQQSITPNDQP